MLVIVPSGEYRIEQLKVVWLPLNMLDNILSMVILDAVTDGKLLCGDHPVFNEVRARVNDYIRRMDLVRTKNGWFPRRALS